MRENLLQKLKRLLKTAGMDSIDFDGKFTACKIHFGEPGNLAYLRPNYARVVTDYVMELGGKPFLTDCNTLYVGRRKNALDHLEAAYENGYNPFATGCPVIIADGLKGTDEAYIDIDLPLVKSAKIGRAVADADVIISINHFKAHEGMGIGGAVKNLGMGCGSRAGKLEMHASGQTKVDESLCVGCGMCKKVCAHGAIEINDKKARVDLNKCAGCSRCLGVCPKDAIDGVNYNANDVLSKKTAEYAYAVIKDKPNFNVNFLMDVSPYCDCHAENDLPVIPDVGMFASFDPVAIDCACADLANAQRPVKDSILERAQKVGDHFRSMHPETDWRVAMDYGQSIGLGSTEYELIKI